MKNLLDKIRRTCRQWWPKLEPVAVAAGLALLLSAAPGCSQPVGMRRITVWGVYGVVLGSPIGIGYFHSEHGQGVQSEESAKPPEVMR